MLQNTHNATIFTSSRRYFGPKKKKVVTLIFSTWKAGLSSFLCLAHSSASSEIIPFAISLVMARPGGLRNVLPFETTTLAFSGSNTTITGVDPNHTKQFLPAYLHQNQYVFMYMYGLDKIKKMKK